ncbi:uncharacterized protein LAESUDRAFT_732773 [Laetiporus sulphureus 93-53]|uniref:F-box domain-containing protein n=1 Tax=Laetiporus sulphureus 93-53 TaxID=1314785 RepID=A0A165AZ91_9APHY|nr:uncharacterized protein LAESUDRAFT_732773 [Laetiporus sulphureus 93-53]KZS99933.1 hypothetical protein LAESUDRAFT_732773 [Laetiporus sulphureus 93-53]
MLAGKLPNLDKLNFYSVSFEHCSVHNTALWSLQEFSHITSLWLRNVTLPSASPFFQVVSSFPRLQHLQCRYLHWSKSRSLAPLPQRHRMPLTTVTSLEYDLSCFEGIGPILLGLLDQANLKTLLLEPEVSAAALAFAQDMLNIAGKRLEEAKIVFRVPKADVGGSSPPFFLHPISFEANVNLQTLDLLYENMSDIALLVRSVLLPPLETISSKNLDSIHFYINNNSEWKTDAFLNAFDPGVCAQIDELLAEGHFPKLRDVSIGVRLHNPRLDDSQRLGLCTEICARFPKLNDKNIFTLRYNFDRFPSDAEKALKAKRLANKQPHPTEQTEQTAA